MTNTVPVRAISRLTPAAYDTLVKETKAKLPLVPKTEGEAFFACGVEYVLTALRTGYVVDL